MSTSPNLLAEGKTKIIWESDTNGIVHIQSKDDITAGDGAKRDVLVGKAVDATTTTCNVFELLERNGIHTHYLGRVDATTFRAYQALMIPLELVVRRVATGSYLKRHREAIEGEIFNKLVFEIFHKDDDAHDPLLGFDLVRGLATRYSAGEPIAANPIDKISLDYLLLGSDPEAVLDQLEETAKKVFIVLETAWMILGVQLVDLKIECGWAGQQLFVADVIDNDSWRIWPASDKRQQKDKQVYRELASSLDPAAKAKELGEIKKNYAWVAEATTRFVK